MSSPSDLIYAIYGTEFPKRHRSWFTFNTKGEPAGLEDITDHEYERLLAGRMESLQEAISSAPDSFDWKSENAQGVPLIILSITYGIESLLDTILERKVYPPDELRQIKNSLNENIITICRSFGQDGYSDKIRSYVKNYN